MLIKRASDIPSSEITSETLYHNRREFIKTASAIMGIAAAGTVVSACAPGVVGAAPEPQAKGKYDTTEKLTPFEDVTMFNNYYEFGTGKDDPGKRAGGFKTKPWTVMVDGLVKKPKTAYNLEDLLKGLTVQDRIYRMRCVEAWSMVIPWQGIPLADLIKKLEPLPSAKYVEFKTLVDKNQYPGQRGFLQALDWPYVEGLRMDEATNPLTLFATGLYGKPLPNQNGAPLRLVTPWKYGFKGIKAIVSINFTDKQPVNSWQRQAANEYGFYANVNPNVDHPRWSQAREQRIGEFFKRQTLMFNGYTEQVASMYSGMDLKKNY